MIAAGRPPMVHPSLSRVAKIAACLQAATFTEAQALLALHTAGCTVDRVLLHDAVAAMGARDLLLAHPPAIGRDLWSGAVCAAEDKLVNALLRLAKRPAYGVVS